jgi:hypothetical protein
VTVVFVTVVVGGDAVALEGFVAFVGASVVFAGTRVALVVLIGVGANDGDAVGTHAIVGVEVGCCVR